MVWCDYKRVLRRSPTHPHYKEEEYIQSKIVLRYDGPGEGARDQVKVHQQPKGTYTLPVFKGLLSVGGKRHSLSLSLHKLFLIAR